MKIRLSPQRRDDTLTIVKDGLTLTLNDERFDFNQISEGSTLPQSAIKSVWLAGDVEMIDGEIILTLWLPLPANYSQEQAFPNDLLVTEDGPVRLPQPLATADIVAVDTEDAQA